MSRRRRIALVGTLVLAFVATSCGAGGGGGPAEAANDQLVDEFETLDGSTIDLASLQGEDVVLWFWAPW